MHRVYRINDLKKFLYLGYDVDMRDERYETPLHYVTRTRNLNLLKALISAGADVNAENRCGQTPLIIAIAYTCNMEIIKEFLNAGADYSSVMDYFKESVMHRAYTEELVIEFRRRGAKVDAKDIYGYTPLHRACRYAFRSDDKTSAVRGLIRAGADVNRRDDNGKTPLYHAVVRGIWQRIIHLISNGAEFGQVISDDTFQTRKCTAIDKVLSRGRPSLTEAVVQHILLQNWAREINLTSIKEYLLNRSNRSVDDYAKRCGRELSRIKNHMIENYSLFDIMKPHIVYKSIKPLYINYDMIKWEEIHERFPIYRFIISEVINDYKLKTAFMIHMINMTYKSCLYSNDDNTEKSVLLNYDSILMICEYLSFDDLKSFYSALQ